MNHIINIIKTFIYSLLCCFIFLKQAYASNEAFNLWLEDVKSEALTLGVEKATIDQHFKHIQFLPSVIKLDRSQPEFINTFLNYYNEHVTVSRVVAGRKKIKQYKTLLSKLESKYGVPKEYLVAFWGMETNYGGYQGNTDSLSALATLAFEGRRADFFKKQLINVLRIIDQQQFSVQYLKGSWAGAFGHMQFMPSTFVEYAIDGDGDNKIDLKNSVPDALTSAANYLSSLGWKFNQPAIIEVQLPSYFPYQLASLSNAKSVSDWVEMGVLALEAKQLDSDFARKVDSSNDYQSIEYKYAGKHVAINPISSMVDDMETTAAIVIPQGWRGPAFLVFDNFKHIMHWNKSVNYALSIALLAKQLEDYTVLAVERGADVGALSLFEMKRLQVMLNKLGFDAGVPDGFPGIQTQSAIRDYQLSAQLPADGYASRSLYYALDQKMLLIN